MANHRNIWVIFAFVLILLIANSKEVMSKAVSDPQYSLSGLTIVHSQIDFFPLFSTPSFGWHVYNSTNFLIDNSTTDCDLHFVDKLGNHLHTPVFYGGHDKGWYSVVNQTLTSKPGTYGYIISCNDTEAGFISGQLDIGELSEKQADFPVSLSITLGLFFIFLIFLAAYFTVKKHPLSYLFVMLCFIMAEVLIFMGYRLLQFNGSPLATILWVMFLIFALITLVMFIVTLLDVTKLVVDFNDRKKTKEDITRFGYA
jgi:hypothetical protein